MLKDRNDAFELLRQLGASDRLMGHARLVTEAADALLHEFSRLGVTCDAKLVELGSILHDAGKVTHPIELSESGSMHEGAGLALLLEHGVQSPIARCCVSHGAWNDPGVSFEEQVVALADKLWKGKREAQLELQIIDEVAKRLGVSRWEVFTVLDSAFEDIAVGGSERLQRSTQD